jgi:acetate kinase
MQVLTVNSGSSSLKLAAIDTATGQRRHSAAAEWTPGSDEAPDIGRGALADFVDALGPDGRPEAIAHRIVHGGERFRTSVLLNDEVRARLGNLGSLAPLHTFQALTLVDALTKLLPDVPQIAIFDTAFHSSLPLRARRYALPGKLCDELGLRRFGFHGLSHRHVADASARFLRRPSQELRIVSCHLGNGASVTAIEHGMSTETSMGMTPLEGLVMGSRAGDLDPGVLLALLRCGRFSIKELEHFLNAEAGLQGMTGTSDLRDIESRAAGGDESCRAALAVYGHRVRKYIGAYTATMGGVDVIAFTGGIGEHSAAMRSRCTQRLSYLGAVLDEDRNRDVHLSRETPVVDIADETSRVRILVVAADEECVMATEAEAVLMRNAKAGPPRVPIAISARHAHLSAATLAQLFGSDSTLTQREPLAQPGQFAAEQTVSLIGPRGRIEHVRLIGPPRAADQIEVSRSDEFTLGIDAPVRDSGDVAGTPGIVVEGPLGRVSLASGVICARRHIHLSAADAARWALPDGSVIAVRVGPAGAETTYRSVRVRVSEQFATQLHLDVDEANAARVSAGEWAELIIHDEAQ